jgi:probable F420-dependent oxidoreductase
MRNGITYGVNILNFGAGTTADVLAGWARLAEDGPFGFAMVSDHVALTGDVTAQYPGPFWDPLATMAYLAGTTERIRLGTTVLIAPYRHPLLTARMVANIDQLSGGRTIVGVGIGWAREEYRALGVDFRRRGDITDEYVRALIALWGDERASFEGEFASFPEVDTRPRPVQEPHPPLWIGGGSPRALRRAVRYGQAWHPLRFPAGWLRTEGVPALRRAAEEEQRPLPELAPRILLEFTERPMRETERLTGQGSTQQIRDDLAELEELGARHVLLDTHLGAEPRTADDHRRHWETLERFADL